MVDITIIGAGIMGASAAYYLSQYQCSIVVLEKENDVAEGASIANSGIIHAGHDPVPDTLKARFNLEGNRLYKDLCEKLSVHFRQTGAFVVATNEEEMQTLQKLKSQAQSREIPYEELTGEAAAALEPNISDQVIAALSLPTTAVVDPWEVTLGLMETAVLNGAELRLNQEVVAIEEVLDTDGQPRHYRITIKESPSQIRTALETKYIINCAGVHGDYVYRLLEPNAEYQITARRGQYFVLDNTIVPPCSRPIYPVPSKVGKGVLAVPTIHKNVLLGPDAEFIENKEGVDVETDRLAFIRESLQKTMKNIPYDKVIRSFSGIRPSGNTGDFIIKEEEKHPHFIQAIGMESPGLTAAPAIAKYVCEEIIKTSQQYETKADFCYRRPPVHLKDLSWQERNEWVKKDSRFGRIICRCETVSEGEILDCIHRPVGARTIKAVKKRVRPGAGRCQGGFCEPRVVEILARELGIPVDQVMYDSARSPILVEELSKGAKHEES